LGCVFMVGLSWGRIVRRIHQEQPSCPASVLAILREMRDMKAREDEVATFSKATLATSRAGPGADFDRWKSHWRTMPR
jgi:hypothetical protein